MTQTGLEETAMDDPSNLALFWAAAIAVSILIYVLLDGFDLGVGILFGTTRDEAMRERMVQSIAPFWDGNETWLVVIGASLFAAFPAVYTVFLGAFYLPVLLMLFGLIFRGVAFEFRYRSNRMRGVWDRGFFLGSLVVAFVQGAAVGALMRGIPVRDNQYAGGGLDWLHPFPILTGIGLVLGYMLLGAGWLILKNDGALRDWAYARLKTLALATSAVLALAFLIVVTVDISVGLTLGASRLDRWMLGLPALCAAALAGVATGAHWRIDALPFALTAVFFVAALLTLGLMMWPFMIPYSITVADAAAPQASLSFFFWGGVVVLPVIGAYTIGVYWVFRGKSDRIGQ
ncbi:cytochrome d ubiquinol oxidase subunit II [Sedimentitalea nanhaiensis]|uniref:Cytochrome bd-I ubiquinol oxidase subunit 2 apoprotein n=1 Tax=Sedimentitalea nanhaiensis TaxID=999627 RepID=A0A1I7AZH8_9RHOB|nr:cytochrome d ubiquinol oxidase subunit II [Sedimentitalea nanhaiensis]SFT80313.1 cytochrome bd-I ubiquinol oxidase subunit 2 apoprotein [Sedimentitalea nanhaiensis]